MTGGLIKLRLSCPFGEACEFTPSPLWGFMPFRVEGWSEGVKGMLQIHAINKGSTEANK